MMMTDAIDKLSEARSNAEQALARADAMALTMGKAVSLSGFGDVGDYTRGDFVHTFTPSDPIGISEEERWATEKAKGESAELAIKTGVSIPQSLRERGYSDAQIAEMTEENENASTGALERALTDFDRGAV
jgi:hypothetical protein